MSSITPITIPMTIPVISPADSESSDGTKTVAVTETIEAVETVKDTENIEVTKTVEAAETVGMIESASVTLEILRPTLAYLEFATCLYSARKKSPDITHQLIFHAESNNINDYVKGSASRRLSI